MKFIVDVADCYIDSEDLEQVLTDQILSRLAKDIRKITGDALEKSIRLKVETLVNDEMTDVVATTMKRLTEEATIIVRGKEVTIENHLKDIFQDSSGWNNPEKRMKEIAHEFGRELKLQYNNVFANKIVLAMKEQDMLKDDVVKVLLGGQDSKDQ